MKWSKPCCAPVYFESPQKSPTTVIATGEDCMVIEAGGHATRGAEFRLPPLALGEDSPVQLTAVVYCWRTGDSAVAAVRFTEPGTVKVGTGLGPKVVIDEVSIGPGDPGETQIKVHAQVVDDHECFTCSIHVRGEKPQAPAQMTVPERRR